MNYGLWYNPPYAGPPYWAAPPPANFLTPFPPAHNPLHRGPPMQGQFPPWGFTPAPAQVFLPGGMQRPTDNNFGAHSTSRTASQQSPTHNSSAMADRAASTSSRRYPDLHPVLASDSTRVRYDVRKPPRESIAPGIYYDHRELPATRRPASRVRLISKEFPWTIDVEARMGSGGVTCGDVWKALHSALQEPLKDSEWALVNGTSGEWSRRQRVEEAAAARTSGDTELLRIDWLGEETVFRGLDREDDFARRRLLPGGEECAETWVVRFGPR